MHNRDTTLATARTRRKQTSGPGWAKHAQWPGTQRALIDTDIDTAPTRTPTCIHTHTRNGIAAADIAFIVYSVLTLVASLASTHRIASLNLQWHRRAAAPGKSLRPAGIRGSSTHPHIGASINFETSHLVDINTSRTYDRDGCSLQQKAAASHVHVHPAVAGAITE